MFAQNIQTMTFTHIMAILTLGRSMEDHLKRYNLLAKKVKLGHIPILGQVRRYFLFAMS